MRAFSLMNFSCRCVSGSSVMSALCVGAILLFGFTGAFARPGAGGGGRGDGRAGSGGGAAGFGARPMTGTTPVAGQGEGVNGYGAEERGYGVAPGVGAGSPGAGTLPSGYHHTIPTNYTTVVYNGYTCYLANGVYYRVTTYNGTYVYVVVP